MTDWNTYRDEITNDVEYFSDMVNILLEEADLSGWVYHAPNSDWNKTGHGIICKAIEQTFEIVLPLYLSSSLDEFSRYWNGRWEIGLGLKEPVNWSFNRETTATFKPFKQKYPVIEFRRLFRNFLRNGELEALRRMHVS
jgi:hypothetical protein